MSNMCQIDGIALTTKNKWLSVFGQKLKTQQQQYKKNQT